VIVGRHLPARPDELKHFGAAAATSGGVELYHIPGITPEAPTLEAAFWAGGALPEAVSYGPAERQAMYETLNEIGSSTDVDFILLGCPHASVDQIRQAAALLDGKRLSPNTELWIMAPRALKVMADRSGYTEVIERAGGRVLADSCPAMSRPRRPAPRCSPPTPPSRRTTCPRSSASRRGSGRWRNASPRPSPGAGTGSALMLTLHGRAGRAGKVEGEALVSHEPISGWGGIDPAAA